VTGPTYDFGGLADGVANSADGGDRRVSIAPPPRPADQPAPPAAPTPSREGRAPLRAVTDQPKRHLHKTTLRLHPDQRRLLGQLAAQLDMFRTQTLAAAVDDFLGDVRKAGPILRPPRRRSGPRPGEETVDYQIDLDPARSKRVHEVAEKISDGDPITPITRSAYGYTGGNPLNLVWTPVACAAKRQTRWGHSNPAATPVQSIDA